MEFDSDDALEQYTVFTPPYIFSFVIALHQSKAYNLCVYVRLSIVYLNTIINSYRKLKLNKFCK